MFSRSGYFKDFISNIGVRLLLAVNITMFYTMFAGGGMLLFGVYVPGMYSFYLLFVMNITSAIIDLISMKKHRRTLAEAIASYLLPLEIYTVLAFGWLWKRMTIIVLAVSILILTAMAILLKTKATHLSNLSFRVRSRIVGRLVAFVLSICFSIMVGRVCYGVFVPRKAVVPTANYTVNVGNEDGWHIRNNIDTLVKLSDGSWDSMTAEDKIDVLQVVVNIDANYLGIPYNLTLSASELPANEATLLAQYRDSDHSILINLDYLNKLTPYECVEGVAHEVFHAEQHCVVRVFENVDEQYKNLLYFSNVETMRNEFYNYIDGKNDLEGYYEQYIEKTARAYGAWSANDYKETIEEYIRNGYCFADSAGD